MCSAVKLALRQADSGVLKVIFTGCSYLMDRVRCLSKCLRGSGLLIQTITDKRENELRAGNLRADICKCCQTETIELIVQSSWPRGRLRTDAEAFDLKAEGSVWWTQMSTENMWNEQRDKEETVMNNLIWVYEWVPSVRPAAPRCPRGGSRCGHTATGAALQTQTDPPGLPEQQTGWTKENSTLNVQMSPELTWQC